jgi:hypothetical protein
MLIFGSCAVKFWFPDFRIPNDLDIISPNDYWISAFDYLIEHNEHNQYVDPNFLFTIKVSHAAWDIHWDKTVKDICWLKNKGCQLDKYFYNLLIEDWAKLHGKKKTKFNVSDEEFFTSKIVRKFDHDFLHSKLAFYDKPLHEKIRRTDTLYCDETLFNELSFNDQIKCALEEIHVIATERWVIPLGFPLKHAKYKALKTLIISASSGSTRPRYTHYHYKEIKRASPTLYLLGGSFAGADYATHGDGIHGMRSPVSVLATGDTDWALGISAEL